MRPDSLLCLQWRPLPVAGRRSFLRRLGIALASPLAVSACGGARPLDVQPPGAERRSNIERDIATTLARCNALAPRTRTAFSAALGILAFPTIVASGINGELVGDGALRVAQAVTGHYLLSAVPAQPGQHRLHALIFLFMTFDALARFQRAPLWPAGEPDLSVPLVAANGEIDPRSRGAAVLAIALGRHMLLPALTLKDLRITPLLV